eukprot:1161481-Pelagomonas_calceolata.AAC.5
MQQCKEKVSKKMTGAGSVQSDNGIVIQRPDGTSKLRAAVRVKKREHCMLRMRINSKQQCIWGSHGIEVQVDGGDCKLQKHGSIYPQPACSKKPNQDRRH